MKLEWKMARKRKKANSNIKVNPPSKSALQLPQPNTNTFHISFPVELHHTDGDEKKICWFKDEIDLKKYMSRYKLKPKECIIKKTEPR